MKRKLIVLYCIVSALLGLMLGLFIMGKHFISSSKTLSIESSQKLYDLGIDGFVPNAETAIKIAEAIWLPIFGEEGIDYKPYKAELKNDSIWVVRGTVPIPILGSLPYIEIKKSDCKILRVSHGITWVE
jgi:hypothetical protein